MPTSLRLNGDRNRAAIYWGEAKRILFQLKNDLELQGIEHGWRNRSYTDGTTIRVGMIYGADIIDINSPFKPVAVAERWEVFPFILCYRSGALYKIYSLKFDDPTFDIAETEKTLTNDNFKLVDSDVGTAVGIVSKPKRVEDLIVRKDHVILYGLSYGNWLITQIEGGLWWNMPITYEDRYLYAPSGVSEVYQIPFRMINGFRRTGGRSSFYNPHLYFPKLVGGNPVWTVLDHNTYAGISDVIGKNNITLNAAKTYAASWGERICEQENAPYTFNLGGITDPFQNIDLPHINWLGRYSWPIIGTLNARKVPKVYSMKYEDDDGSHTTEDYWTETLDYDGPVYDIGTASSLTYWPIAAIGNKKFLYLKNTLAQETTYSYVENWSYPPIWSGEGPAGTSSANSDYTEDITQEFYAGIVLVESLLSTIQKTYSRNIAIVATGGWAIGTYSEIIEETLETTYRWVEVLDYSNLDGNLIVVYKKITENIDWPRSYSNIGAYSPGSGIPPSPPRIVLDSRIGTCTRKVEYYLATIIDGVLTKRLLETFDGTCDTAMNFVGEDDGVDITGTRIVASEEDGAGERIYGVSCQMNSDYAVFSFNKETFDGTGANAEDYFKSKVSVTKIYNWFGDALPNTDPLPYPSPLEDMNLILDTATEAWVSGHFCVGAIGIEKHPGVYAYAEFDNQVDVVAATGIIDLLGRIE